MASGQHHVEMSQLDTMESRGVYSLEDDRKERQPECKKHWTQLLDPLLALPCTLCPSLWDYWQSQPKTRTQNLHGVKSLDRRAKQSQQGKQTKKDSKADFFFIIKKLGRCFFKLRQNKILSLSNLISKATTETKQKQWGSRDVKIRLRLQNDTPLNFTTILHGTGFGCCTLSRLECRFNFQLRQASCNGSTQWCPSCVICCVSGPSPNQSVLIFYYKPTS